MNHEASQPIGRPRRRSLAWAAVAAFALVLACHLWRVGVPPMAGTEAFRAIPAHEMASSGDWRLPTIYGELYLTKPPGHPWLLAAAERLTGHADEWAWRSVSAISSALLAALLAIMAGRWFGLAAAWTAGLGYMTLMGLWAQSRTAEIDASMTLACVACALCFMEIGFGPRRRLWPWAVAAAVALGATLLIKFHQGLIVVGGALIGATLANGLWLRGGERSLPMKLWRYIAGCPWRWLIRPATWLALLGGVGLFAAWAVVAWQAIEAMPGGPDTTGLKEAGSNTLDFERVGRALLVPVTLTAMGLPLAFVLLIAGPICRRHGDEPDHRPTLTRGLFGLIAVSFVILIVNGVINPRYGYITLPFWALLAGRAAQLWQDQHLGEQVRTAGRQIATGLVVGVPIGHIVVTTIAWPDSRQQWMLGLTLGLAALAAVLGLRAWLHQRLIAGGLAVAAVFALISIPIGDIKAQARWNRSAYQPALQLRDVVQANPVGDEPRVIAFAMLRDKPELFWYAGLPVTARFHERKADEGHPPIDRPGWYALQHAEWQAVRDRVEPTAVYDKLYPQGVLVRIPPGGIAPSAATNESKAER